MTSLYYAFCAAIVIAAVSAIVTKCVLFHKWKKLDGIIKIDLLSDGAPMEVFFQTDIFEIMEKEQIVLKVQANKPDGNVIFNIHSDENESQ